MGIREYLQCVHEPAKDQWRWDLRECEGDNVVFDTNLGDCAVVTQGQFCRQTDSRGSEWFALAGDTAVKSCEEDLGEGATGDAFWYCDPSTVPLFGTEEPDRSDCQESWVGDIEDLVTKK